MGFTRLVGKVTATCNQLVRRLVLAVPNGAVFSLTMSDTPAPASLPSGRPAVDMRTEVIERNLRRHRRARRAAPASWRLPGSLTRSARGLNRVGRRGSRRRNPSEWWTSPRQPGRAHCGGVSLRIRQSERSQQATPGDRPAPWLCLREPSPHATRATRCLNFSAGEPSKKKPCASCSSPTPLYSGNGGAPAVSPSRTSVGSHCDLAACWANGGRASRQEPRFRAVLPALPRSRFKAQ